MALIFSTHWLCFGQRGSTNFFWGLRCFDAWSRQHTWWISLRKGCYWGGRAQGLGPKQALGTASTASQCPGQNPQPKFLTVLCTTTLSDDDDDDDDDDPGYILMFRPFKRFKEPRSLEHPKTQVTRTSTKQGGTNSAKSLWHSFGLIGNSNLLVDGLLDAIRCIPIPPVGKFPFILLTTNRGPARTGPANMAPIPWRVPPWFGTCLTGRLVLRRESFFACWTMKGPEDF